MNEHTEQAPTQETPAKQSFWQGLGEFTRFTIIVIVIVVLVRTFIAQPFVVSGPSMVPTFQNANYLLIDEVSYRFKQPARGDVIVFKPPYDSKIYLIKRIIGLPNDTVTIKDGVVTITNTAHPEGLKLSEDYTAPDMPNDNQTVTVPENMYFVMGDNRSVSYDSRRWGLLPKEDITGRVFLRLFPLSKLSLFPGEHRY